MHTVKITSKIYSKTLQLIALSDKSYLLQHFYLMSHPGHSLSLFALSKYWVTTASVQTFQWRHKSCLGYTGNSYKQAVSTGCHISCVLFYYSCLKDWELYCTILHCIFYIALHCIFLHCIALLCIVLKFHCSRLPRSCLKVPGGWMVWWWF